LAIAHDLNGDSAQALQQAQRALTLAEAGGTAYDRKLARRTINKIRKKNL
jgi:hypothetical protein